ncbi:hypothetical protein IE53DRAFT_110775 [Violaceomyces palustris]|uniref:Uncharacterized protein n=1 Tax=Violaceomyces palustris TaxID=1673888 RepID=A0ACD0NWA9_9BASI|nr:hypothetical protein IE53DRAFT_110775 [Violaceomyces palustris]
MSRRVFDVQAPPPCCAPLSLSPLFSTSPWRVSIPPPPPPPPAPPPPPPPPLLSSS